MALETNTLVYSPGIRISIACRSKNGEVIDVSEDIVQGSVTISENASHGLTFSLSNQNGKYSNLFHPNDRIVVQLKRLKWVQVFAGYLTQVPYFSVYPQDVTITAECTYKKIKYQLWNPALPQTLTTLQNKISGGYAEATTSNPVPGGPADKGLTNAIRWILTDVVGWSKDRIHIGSIPAKWFENLAPLWAEVEGQIKQNQLEFFSTPLGQQFMMAGMTGGTTTTDAAAQQGATPPDWGGKSAPKGTSIPKMVGYATNYDVKLADDPNSPGAINLSVPLHVDQYWSACHWGYADLPQDQWQTAKDFLAGPDGKGMRLVITNQENGNIVVVRAIDYMGSTEPAIDLSPQAWRDLAGTNDMSAGVLHVTVNWAKDPKHPVGKFNSAAVASPNHSTDPVSANTDNKSKDKGNNDDASSLLQQADGAQKAVAAALSLQGVPYGRGADPHQMVDCSQLTQYAWKQAGIDIGYDTYTQFDSPHVVLVDIGSRLPGDLLFSNFGSERPPGHVSLLGNNDTVISANTTGVPASVTSLNQYLIDVQSNGAYFLGVGRVISGNYGSTQKAKTQITVDPSTVAVTNTGLNANSNMTYGTGAWNPAAAAPDNTATAYTGLKLLMNRNIKPVSVNLDQMVKASQRSWCTAPNGDFIAWFPDYFGQYGYAGVWNLSPVEMQSFQITWSDTNFKTHQFVSGSSANQNASIDPTKGGDAPTLINEIYSFGVASIDVRGLLNAVTNVSSQDGGIFGNADAIYQQFGARPEYEAMPNIPASSFIEFWFAVRKFQMSISRSFDATVQTTFMPEVWPGMLLRIKEFGFQAYVYSVTHTWNLGNNGSFSTSIKICAPSATDGSGMVGLAKRVSI